MINYNIDPYYDDFDPTKNYHRILFKPGVAVQARELTQLQTIQQNQISSFASAIYSQNTPISGGKITTNLKCFYLKLNLAYLGNSVDVASYLNETITDSTKTVLATVIAVSGATGTTINPGDPPTLIISYLSGGRFTDNETIYHVGTDGQILPFATTIATASTGSSSVASISSGVFFVVNGTNKINSGGTTQSYSIGNFVQVNPQTAILSKYSNLPSTRLGLNIVESTVTYADDASLLDPAIGATNYQAPGADRYQITLNLETRPLALGNDDTFIELVQYENGAVKKQTNSTVYSLIDDYFAKRTFDTNGDFIVNNFTINPVANSNPALYDLKISKGLAYVKGYRVENQTDLYLTNNRARDEATSNTSLYFNYGNYFYVDTVKGLFDVTKNSPIDLHSVPASQINTANTITYNSTKVGTGYIRNLIYETNVSDANTQSYIYSAYVFDLSTNLLSSNVASVDIANTKVTVYDTNGKFSGTNNAYLGATATITTANATTYTALVTGYNAATKTFTLNTSLANYVTPTISSTFTLNLSASDIDSIVSASGTTITASANINTSKGKLNGVANGYTVLYGQGNPQLVYPLGSQYVGSVSMVPGTTYQSTVVFRNVPLSGSSFSITLNNLGFAAADGTLSTKAIEDNFIVVTHGNNGDVLDYTSAGNTVVVSGQTATFTSTKWIAPLNVDVIAKVKVPVTQSSGVLKTKTLVTGNTVIANIAGTLINTNPLMTSSNVYVNTVSGQTAIAQNALLGVNEKQSLYVSDVKKIVKIIDSLDPNEEPDPSMFNSPIYDVTNRYLFNNGQKDAYYDHAYISLMPGAPKPIGNILVIYDYYSHSGGDGYFTVNSYTNENYGDIGTYTTSAGITYNLTDVLDFRTTRQNGSTSLVFDYSNQQGNNYGILLPDDQTAWEGNYYYYLSRWDRLILTKEKNFQIIQGNPAIIPNWPPQPEGSLLIANLKHSPYTAFLPNEAPKGTVPGMSIQMVQHKRWRMSDISDLETRVNNIEYYTSLNLLEGQANNLQVPDENGINRFKNGILVDDFTTYAVADTANPDYKAAVDRANQKLLPPSIVTSHVLYPDPIPVPDPQPRPHPTPDPIPVPVVSSNVVIKQVLASNTISLNPFTCIMPRGHIHIHPAVDNWLDHRKDPDLITDDDRLQFRHKANTLNKVHVSNWKTLVGVEHIPNKHKTTTSNTNITISNFGIK